MFYIDGGRTESFLWDGQTHRHRDTKGHTEVQIEDVPT